MTREWHISCWYDDTCVTEDCTASALQLQAWWNDSEIKLTVPLNACVVDQKEWQKVLTVCRLCNSRKTNKHVTECFVISKKKQTKKTTTCFTRESLFERQKPSLVEKSWAQKWKVFCGCSWNRRKFRLFTRRFWKQDVRTSEAVSRFCLNKSRLWCKQFRLYCLIALWVMQVPARKRHWIKMMHLPHPS